ncbi:zinc finger CCCH domain-containing protein 48-like isoform X2 [Glycine soja]|uniref:zinc finger CCCH domain-containing protein 48-like isoform X2 n=1 Tax=Glycine soja TaxID=3848 RepID=UPI000719413F|nr:zinc finger CCCH domain-containing protein 48-like isoform X2 [Glycine soja]|eukprot:XP_014624398.1 zinc finger CCCH domain-containing protein 48 isoform X2 [Glycine max]
MDVDGGNKRVYNRLGGDAKHQKVCFHWQAGKCNRYPCPFLHSELPANSHHANGASSKRAYDNSGFSGPRRSPSFNNTWGRGGSRGGGGAGAGAGRGVVVKAEKVCNYWIQGNCSYGERCKFLHTWSVGDGFSLLTQLEGHQKAVSAIAFPSGSDKLYTGSTDETARIWDCQSGKCVGVINLGGEVGCMISEGPWVFVGIPNFVKAWNTQNLSELSLNGPVGQVYALVVNNDMLFAGTQDGSILAWKFNVATNCFEPAASLKGHSRGVVSLVVGANRLYSGSMDNTIRVWNLETLQCLQTLTEHTSVVMSVLCWDQFLLSCSLDKTVKGILTLCGMHDSQGKPILLCACNDNTVHLYDLPSFAERGKILTKKEVRAIQIGPNGIFFTGDGTGEVRVWNWIAEATTTTQ